MKLIKYLWLGLAIAAFIGVCCGATHQILTFGMSALMYAACRDDEEADRA